MFARLRRAALNMVLDSFPSMSPASQEKLVGKAIDVAKKNLEKGAETGSLSPADKEQLNAIIPEATRLLPEIVERLKGVLEPELPPANELTESVRNEADVVANRLLDLVPGRFREEAEQARKMADDAPVDWKTVRQRYRVGLAALPHIAAFEREVNELAVLGAFRIGLTPEEARAYVERVELVAEVMLPKLESTDADLAARLHAINEMLPLLRLAADN